MDTAKYGVMIFVISFSLVYIAVFCLVPNSSDGMAFVPEKIMNGEWYRVFTFPFAHLDFWHLTENVVSLLIVGVIATELKTEFYDFAVIYIAASFLAIIPMIAISSFSAVGASAAVYGGFGVITQKLSELKVVGQVPLIIMIGVVFVRAITSIFECGINCDSFAFAMKQGGVHFSGLLMGAGMFKFMNNKPISPKSILRGVAYGG